MQLIVDVLMGAVEQEILRGGPCTACGAEWSPDETFGPGGTSLTHTSSCTFCLYADNKDEIAAQQDRLDERLQEAQMERLGFTEAMVQ